MHLAQGRFEKLKSFFRNRGKKFWVPIFALFLVIFGVGTYFLVRTSASSGQAYVTKRSNSRTLRGVTADSSFIRYGVQDDNDSKTWGTYRYNVSTSSGDFTGMCLQPNITGPNGETFDITIDTSDEALITKEIMLVSMDLNSTIASAFESSNPNFWDNLSTSIRNIRTRDTSVGYSSSYYWTDYYYNYQYETGCKPSTDSECTLAYSTVPKADYVFALGHMMIGSLVNQVSTGLTYNEANAVESAAQSIVAWFNNNATYKSVANRTALYSTVVPTYGSVQRIGWLESVAPSTTSVQICKKEKNTGTRLNGATFSVDGIGSKTTTSNGCTATFDVDGSTTSITFHETSAPSGYVLDGSNVTCNISADVSVNTCWAKDNEKVPTAYIKIKKVANANSSTTYAGLTVVGTVFSVKNGSNAEVATITIGSDGTGTTNTALPVGTYTITEKTVTTGFNTNGTSLSVTLDSSNTASTPSTVDMTGSPFRNDVITGKISFTKTGYELGSNNQASSRNLGGITFTAINKADSSISYTIGPTASDGSVTSPSMVYGNYTVTENRSNYNNAYNLISFDATVNSTSTTAISADQTNDTIPDTPALTTIARNSNSTYESPDKEIEISDSASITDRITCSGLQNGAQYKLEGELYELSSGTRLSPTGASTFTADASGTCGNLDMVFSTFDTSAYMDKTLSIKQTLYKNNSTSSSPDWIRIFIHNDNLAETSEQVKVKNIQIETTAYSPRSVNNKELAAGSTWVNDHYSIVGLVNGQSYTVEAVVKDASNNTIGSQSNNITMSLATGTTYTDTINISVDTSAYIGQTIFVHLTLKSSGGATLATHTGTTNNGEYVTVLTPTISTVAVNNRDGSSKELEVGAQQVKDTVSYTGLVSGNVYRLEGQLVRADNGDVIASKNQDFTASGETGSAAVTFDVTTAELIGKSLVVYERLYYGNNKIAEHVVSTDTNQTVTVKTPTIHTVAVDDADGDKWLDVSDGIKVKDTVTYDGLVQGNSYTVVLKLVKQSDTSVELATGTKDFQASGISGSVDVVSSAFDSSAYVGQNLVAYEYLYYGSTLIAKHPTENSSSTDVQNQTVTVKTPEISTTAVDKVDGSSKQIGVGSATVKDTIHYKELAVGKSYKLIGSLVRKDTGAEVASAIINSFTPTQSEDDVVMDFGIDTSTLIGLDLVVYEYLYFGNNKIAEHEELTDANQTVTVKIPSVATVAVDDADGDKFVEVDEGIKLKDTVTYDELIQGDSYTLVMKVLKRSDPDPEHPIATGTKDFQASGISGSVDVISAAFDSTTLHDADLIGLDLVVYEYLYYGSNLIGSHEDKDDTQQIVTVKTPTIHTSAVDWKNGTQKLGVGLTTVTDTVTFTDLVPGRAYTITGTLMDKATGQPAQDADGHAITATLTDFVPTTANGTTTLTFNIFDTTLFYDYAAASQKEYVVFEKLYKTNVEIAHHEDLTDQAQTVQIATPKIQTTATYKVDGSNLLGVGDVTMVDYADYEGLVEGDWYTIVGAIIDPTTGEILEIDDEFVENTKTFKADVNGKGRVALEINLNTVRLQGRSFVVHERLYRSQSKHGDGRLLAEHKEALDEGNQTITVKVATIGTVAKDAKQNPDGSYDDVLDHEDGQTIVDTVHYDGLLMDEEYTLYGYLWDKTNNRSLLGKDGK
ncbi:VaFE repeat-containing surface-anchored protein, partial [Candidatus Saccharibacteria bacterium]|nr:VaFE repeat-containing surface-anchored protein [Candidatus Saccharibacteria bacterium]